MADQQWAESQAEIKACAASQLYNDIQYFEVTAVVGGVEGLYVTSKEAMAEGTYKVSIGESKNKKYVGYIKKAKEGQGVGGGGFQQKARDYTIENRQKALDTVVHHAQGKGDMNALCTIALQVAEFYAKGTVPPKKEPQA